MDFVETINATGYWLRAVILNEWTHYQLALIAVGYLVCGVLARHIEPAVEARARTIKGNPDLLRVIIAFMRRLRWLFLILWLWIADVLLLRFGWPSYRWLVSTALTLAAAWFVISVLTRLIRNQMLARAVAVAGWSYFALYALGLDDVVLAALDGMSVNLGAVRLSMLIVLKAIVLSAALIWMAVLIGRVTSHWIEGSGDLTPSFKVLISKLDDGLRGVIARFQAEILDFRSEQRSDECPRAGSDGIVGRIQGGRYLHPVPASGDHHEDARRGDPRGAPISRQ